VDAFPIEFLGEFNDAYCIEGALLNAYSAACAEILVYDRLLLPLHESDRVTSVQHFRAEAIAGYSTIIRFAMLLVKYGYSYHSPESLLTE